MKEKQRCLELIQTEKYNFLRENKNLGKNVILLSLGGSRAYGTNMPESDVDIRGCALGSARDVLGYAGAFEQVVDVPTDTTIYEVTKFLRLLVENNPAVLEILGVNPEHILQTSKEGELLWENKDIFYNRRCIYTFGHYASAQLSRLENALLRSEDEKHKEEQLKKSIDRAMLTFPQTYPFLKETGVDIQLKEALTISMGFKEVPLKELTGMLAEMQNISKQYGKVNNRNKKRDIKALDKHAMHLVRLYLTGLDLLEQGKMITHRGKDLELLMRIRNGGYRVGEVYTEEFYAMVGELEKRFEYASKHTCLPEEVDAKKVLELQMTLNESILKRT